MSFSLSTSALRSPLSATSSYTSSFGIVPHAALNGELAASSSYVSIHLSPQISGAVVYGRSPMVSNVLVILARFFQTVPLAGMGSIV